MFGFDQDWLKAERSFQPLHCFPLWEMLIMDSAASIFIPELHV